MPTYLDPVGQIVLLAMGAALIGCVLSVAFAAPIALVVIGPLAIWYGILVYRSRRHWLQVEIERKEESICDFARALPAREHDTWVVRAVYEELSGNRDVSVRPTDRLEQDLGFLPEDLDDCVAAIARRAGRSLSNPVQNPLFGRVVTAADLVTFLEHQPKA